ncbi:MAG: hypothetical protein DCC49_05270 [Acidobacteria bacterium]|nr:MAG: hypothetical protein DCC49_05270 [Acidobacteriota bacterium]
MVSRVALVSARDFFDLDEDLPLVQLALEARGIGAVIVDWHDRAFEWGSVELAVVRSTWDYTSRLDEFIAWAERVASATVLCNPVEILRWNTHKRYLIDLASAGLPVVPTELIEPEPGVAPTVSFIAAKLSAALNRFDDEQAAPEIVVKPAVSAGARDTERYALSALDLACEHVNALLAAGRSVLVQPYVRSVDSGGETGLVFAGDAYSHAFRKDALLGTGSQFVAGHYREETISAVEASADQLKAADAILDSVADCVPGRSRRDLLYARVDFATSANGTPLLMELELTEPSLFCAYSPGSADRFADAIAGALGRSEGQC